MPGKAAHVWAALRALDRFQAGAMAAAADTALESAAAMAVSAVGFAREFPEDARLLLTIRPADLFDDPADEALAEAVAARNAPLVERLRRLARDLYGSDDPRSVEAVSRAVVDLPYSAVRRHSDGIPPWLAGDLVAAVRALLTGYRP